MIQHHLATDAARQRIKSFNLENFASLEEDLAGKNDQPKNLLFFFTSFPRKSQREKSLFFNKLVKNIIWHSFRKASFIGKRNLKGGKNDITL